MASIIPTNKKYRTLALKAGETGVLPSGVTIISVVTTGDININSDCILPEPVGTRCYNYEFAGRLSGGDSGYFSAYFDSYTFGGQIFPLPASISTVNIHGVNVENLLNFSAIPKEIKDALLTAGVVAANLAGCFDSTGQSTYSNIIQLTIPENIEPGSIRLKVFSDAINNFLFYDIEPVLSNDCSIPCNA